MLCKDTPVIIIYAYSFTYKNSMQYMRLVKSCIIPNVWALMYTYATYIIHINTAFSKANNILLSLGLYHTDNQCLKNLSHSHGLIV